MLTQHLYIIYSIMIMFIPKPLHIHLSLCVCVLQIVITEGTVAQIEALLESINNLTVRSKHTWAAANDPRSQFTHTPNASHRSEQKLQGYIHTCMFWGSRQGPAAALICLLDCAGRDLQRCHCWINKICRKQLTQDSMDTFGEATN